MPAQTYSPTQLRGFSITTGAALDENFVTAVFTNDARMEKDPEDRHSYLGLWKGEKWITVESAYPVRSQAALLTSEPCIFWISDLGNVRRTSRAIGKDEVNVGETSQRVHRRTRLFEVRAIADRVYAVGARRAVYRRSAPDIWDCIDDGCYTSEDFGAGFQSIHGFSAKEIYAVGARGEIWEHDGKKWSQRKSGTDKTLHRVLCASDGNVYAVGKQGTILRGRHDAWSPIKSPTKYEYWSIQDHGGRIFLTASTRLALELDGKTVRPVDFGECEIPTTAYHLTLGAGDLYLFGAKHIRRFDGTDWHDILSLD